MYNEAGIRGIAAVNTFAMGSAPIVFEFPSDALLRVNGLKFACASNGYKRV